MKSRLPAPFVAPAKAGVHHQWLKLGPQVMDSRIRRNDENEEGA